MPELEIHYDPDGDWAALYVDGQLERVGDAYLAEGLAFELAGVRVVRDNAFLRGQGEKAGVAETIVEVAAYQIHRKQKAAEAQSLRDRAAELLAQAAKLDGE